MNYEVYAERQGFQSELCWVYTSIEAAETAVQRLLDNGYDEAWIYPASEAQALELLEAEVASLRPKLRNRNRQIRDLRRALRK